MSHPVIRTRELTRDLDEVRAVDGLSLEVSSGTVFGFLGPNGSGKTTTIRLLLGLLEPTEGSAEVLDYDIVTESDAIRNTTGALLHDPGLYEWLTAEENLEVHGRIRGLAHPDLRDRIQELLQRFDLWERRGEPTRRWSRGMKQRLAVARTLLHRPRLVFLDEPTTGLDPEIAVSLREEILKLAHADGVTVFLTTHNLLEAEKVCEQVAVIQQGQLLAAGDVASVTKGHGSLEDAYLDLVRATT